MSRDSLADFFSRPAPRCTGFGADPGAVSKPHRRGAGAQLLHAEILPQGAREERFVARRFAKENGPSRGHSCVVPQ